MEGVIAFMLIVIYASLVSTSHSFILSTYLIGFIFLLIKIYAVYVKFLLWVAIYRYVSFFYMCYDILLYMIYFAIYHSLHCGLYVMMLSYRPVYSNSPNRFCNVAPLDIGILYNDREMRYNFKIRYLAWRMPLASVRIKADIGAKILATIFFLLFLKRDWFYLHQLWHLKLLFAKGFFLIAFDWFHWSLLK